MAKTATLTCMFIFYITFALAKLQQINSQDLQHLKTKWMTHLGCFSVTGLGDSTSVKLTNITNNQPKTCSRQCENWNFFALLDFNCFCFKEATFKKFTKGGVSNRCYRKCPNYSDKMYCGSIDMKYANLYRHDEDLPLDVIDKDFDCLTVSKNKTHKEIKQMSCDQAVPFICSGHHKPVEQKLTFKQAKLYCENLQKKMMNFSENLPQKTEDNIYYWVGTFRQLIDRHEETIIYTSTATRSYPVKSTQDISKQETTITPARTFEQDTMTTERTTSVGTSANLPTKISTFFAKEEGVTQSGTISKSMKSEDHPDDIKCGIFCVVLGIFSSCVSILVLLVCLFKIREKWNGSLNRNEQLSNRQNVKAEHSSDDTDAFKENRPVYLDPSNQKAVFHKQNLSTLHINQHIYDEAGIYSKTNLPTARQACVSGYQELNFCIDKTKEQNVQESDDDKTVKYEDPWGKSSDNRKENSKLKPSPKKRFSLGFRSSIFRRKEKSQTEAYEETMINHKQYVYDQPTQEKEQRKTEPWVNYKYRPSLPVGIGGFIMTGGRGLSIADTIRSREIETSLRKTENPPDIILHNSVTGEDTDNNIYATPQLPMSENEKAKRRGSHFLRKITRKGIKSKLLKIPKSIKKIRRQTVATTEDEYDVPNPVGRPAANTQSLLIESNERHGLPVHYEFASPLVNTNRCSNLASEHFIESKGLKKTYRSNTKSSLISPYQLAKPLPNPREPPEEKEIVYFEPVA
ncbi:uncharacterized protein LOC127708340 [Mytilus californianus]|uniref:uncharacterized protein LOC127708340 n=1 Tax=Mytilus californianus TaxID=6549 RepID=UPI0022470388|nr:uncharacterized protein LOC127708340 [Mytilus californianus]